MSTIDTSKVNWPEDMDLNTAAFYLGIAANSLRAAAQGKRVKASKDEANHWHFKRADLDVYKTQPRRTGGPRGDGKAWIIRVKYADLEKVKADLGKYGIQLEPRYKYQGKKEKKAAPSPAPTGNPTTK